MINERTAYALSFNSLGRLRYHQQEAIFSHFGFDLAAAWHNAAQWREIANLSEQASRELLTIQRSLNPERLYEQYRASGFSLSTRFDDDFPPLIKRIYDPPLLLFYLGQLPTEDMLCIGMVGARKATAYGRQVGELLSRELAAQGVVIVSGMARGIDSCCHRGALDAGGLTVAVLGSGIDVIYPPENAKLYQEIAHSGAVISEFPLGMAALSKNFPRRNRIISALSRGVVAIEAAEKSGALLTMDFALEQGRDVFAVPGNITSEASRGTNNLIKNGAQIVCSAADVWSHYSDKPLQRPLTKPQANQLPSKTDNTERQLLELLSQPRRADEIDSAALGLQAADLAARLTLMEMRGLLKQLPGGYYHTVIKRLD